jgi:hypothetical protein
MAAVIQVDCPIADGVPQESERACHGAEDLLSD